MPKQVATKRQIAVASTFPRWDDPRTFQEPCASRTSSWWNRRVATVDFRPFPNKGAAFKGAKLMSDVYLNILL